MQVTPFVGCLVSKCQ